MPPFVDSIKCEVSMPGSLFHAKSFTVKRFIGSDGLEHHEVCGDAEVVSWTSWMELKRFGESVGIPTDSWPEFLDCDSGIDVDVDLAAQKSDLFKAHCAKIPMGISYPYWFEKILVFLDCGETVFFC
jgi:hypothetical protein